MDYENISQQDKCVILEYTVLTKSPEEISALYRQLGEVPSSARALGLACRFRGLEHVRALVESGADFNYVRLKWMNSYDQQYYWLALLEMGEVLYHTYTDRRDACFRKYEDSAPLVKDAFLPGWFCGALQRETYLRDVVTDGEAVCEVLPTKQRVEIVRYLYEHREEACLDVEELLFYAIMSSNWQVVKVLKEYGVLFSKQRIAWLTEGGRSDAWFQFCHMLAAIRDEDYLEVVGSIVREMGGNRLCYTEAVYQANYDPYYYKKYRLYQPEIFKFTLEHFDQKKMNKAKLMRGAIDHDSVACLELCVQNGWLEAPRKRDEMIQYASDHDKTECAAWLLEYKNRTADFAAEREKAEKKVMRELNASPDSVTELKKVWGYEKREDGTVIITRYKGTRTEVDVPEKIGGSAVTAIGATAFSPGALRLKMEQSQLRRSITRITLPETIEMIGDGAFDSCWALAEINIPGKVTAIGANAFYSCQSLRSVKLPDALSEIGVEAFGRCRSLQSVTIPPNVGTIRKRTFQGCTALETVVVSEGVTEMEVLAFAGCTNLKSVELPQSLGKIKNYTRKGQAPQTIFDSDADVTVTPKSYAEKYCKRNNIRYVYKEA